MKELKGLIDKYLGEAIWSGKVETKWKPPAGLFTQSSEKIASALAAASANLKQAMSRLNFYINRAGKNLTDKDIKRLNKVKDLLKKMK